MIETKVIRIVSAEQLQKDLNDFYKSVDALVHEVYERECGSSYYVITYEIHHDRMPFQ